MPSAAEILTTAINVIQTATGLTSNTCIAYFCFKSLKSQPGSNQVNVIYFTIGLVNIVMQLLDTAENSILCFRPQIFLLREIYLTTTVVFGFIYFNYWLIGWLCAYYCVNINNFTHQLIIAFKRLLSSFLPQILLLSAIGSFILSVSSIWMVDVFVLPSSVNGTEDYSAYIAYFVTPPGYRVLSAFLGCCLPFVLALISTGITTLSLIKHILKMKQNISESSSPSLQALVGATRTMVLLLTLSVIFYMGQLIFLSTTKRSSSDAINLIAFIVITSFPSVEGVIIIQATPKLRKRILEKFWARTQIISVID